MSGTPEQVDLIFRKCSDRDPKEYNLKKYYWGRRPFDLSKTCAYFNTKCKTWAVQTTSWKQTYKSNSSEYNWDRPCDTNL